MSTTRFGGISPESTAPQPSGPPAVTGTGSMVKDRSRRRIPGLVLGAVAATLLVAIAVMALRGCSHPRSATAVRAAHGPTQVTAGVPNGYARDRDGAATAAVNLVQALSQAGQGRVAAQAVRSVLVAANPGPGLAQSLELAAGRDQDANVLNVLPAAVNVETETADAARVSVWTVAVSRYSITAGDPVSVMTLWASTTVSLVWAGGDWKATDIVTRTGPAPDEVVTAETGSPLTGALLGGYYSFYVN